MAKKKAAAHSPFDESLQVALRVLTSEVVRLETRLMVLERRLGLEGQPEPCPVELPLSIDDWRRKQA